MAADVIEYKTLPTGPGGSEALTGVIGHDDGDGTITAIVAVSGVRDDVGDVIVPGSLGRAIKRVKPKGVHNHNWGVKTSKVVYAEELMPGDSRLPPQTASGEPWPKEAGGLLIKAKYNLEKKEGRDAYSDAKFYGPEESFSIGYKVRPGGARKRGDSRYLTDYDIFEYSQVLHGAHRLAHLTGVKSLLDTVTAPDSWYDGGRSDLGEGDGSMEFKVRYVRDPQFWGLPLGTPIRPGMKPRGERARAVRAQGRTPDPREGTAAPEERPEALLPEEGARRVKPREPDEYHEVSDDPAADLAALIHRASAHGVDESETRPLLAEVLDDALTPAEFEEELRDVLDDDDPADVVDEVLDDYRMLYRERLTEQERTGRAGVNPEVRIRAIDAAADAIDDQNHEKLAKALRALEDDDPEATADYLLSDTLSFAAGHKRFEAVDAALRAGKTPPRADADLGDDALQAVVDALVNSRDDEVAGSEEFDRADAAVEAASAELEKRGKPAPKPSEPPAPEKPAGRAPLTTADYERIKRDSHPAARDAALRKLTDGELAAIKHESLRRGKRAENMQNSVRSEEIYRRITPVEIRQRAEKMGGGGAFDGMIKRLRERADDYERRDAAGVGRHDFDALPLGEAPVPKLGKPEVDLNDLSALDDAALAAALDDARREYRRLVENGVPRLNSTLFHDAKRDVTMLEDEQRRRPAELPGREQEKPVGDMSLEELRAERSGLLRPDRTPAETARLQEIRGAMSRLEDEQHEAETSQFRTRNAERDAIAAITQLLKAANMRQGERNDFQVTRGYVMPQSDRARTFLARHADEIEKATADVGHPFYVDRRSGMIGKQPPKSEAPAAPQPGASEIRQARADAEDAISDQDRDALADALTRMGVGTGDDDRDPRDVAAGLLTIPSDVVEQRLDRMVQAATMVAESEPDKPAEAAPERSRDATTAVRRIQSLIDKIEQADKAGENWANLHGAVVAMTTVSMLSQFTARDADVHASPGGRYAAVNNGKTWVIVDTTNTGTIPGMSPDTDPAKVDAALAELAKAGDRLDRSTAEQIVEHYSAPRREPEMIAPEVMQRARADAGAALDAGDAEALTDALSRMGETDPESRAGSMLAAAGTYPAQVRRRLDELAEDNVAELPPSGAKPEEVITSGEQADAEAVRGDALGLVEAEDGELEVTEEVAQRQDRVEALIESGFADVGARSDDELGGTRRDLVDELKLQDEIRRRDAARRQEARQRRTQREASADTGEAVPAETEAPGPAPEPEQPKVRPGLAGAIEDLADALGEHGVKAHDHEAVQAAAARLATVLRRNKSDSATVKELRELLGDDVLAQIKAGKLRPGRLLTLAGQMRQEARDRRNATARARRLARRIERERIRSLIGQVDTELRRRGRDPEQYGGPVAAAPTPERERQAAAARPEPDMGDLAQHRRPADLVAEDQASRDRAAQARELIRQARQASEDGDHARAVDLMERAQAADPSRADRMTEMRDRFAALRDQSGELTTSDLQRGTLNQLGVRSGDRMALLIGDGKIVQGRVEQRNGTNELHTDDGDVEPLSGPSAVQYGVKLDDDGRPVPSDHEKVQPAGESAAEEAGHMAQRRSESAQSTPARERDAGGVPDILRGEETPAEPGDMTDEQLRAADARMEAAKRASGARSITDEHRAIKAELGRRSSIAARSRSAKRGAETRARRREAGLPPQRQPFSFDRPPAGGWTDFDRVDRPEPGWGKPHTESVAYSTPDGPVWMFRNGQRVRFYNAGGEQVGPEQPNVAPASAYAHSEGWRPPSAARDETATDRNGPVSVQVSGTASGDTGQREPNGAELLQAIREADQRGDYDAALQAIARAREVMPEREQKWAQLEATIKRRMDPWGGWSLEQLIAERDRLRSEKRNPQRQEELGEEIDRRRGSAPGGTVNTDAASIPRRGVAGAMEDLADAIDAGHEPTVRLQAQRLDAVTLESRSEVVRGLRITKTNHRTMLEAVQDGGIHPEQLRRAAAALREEESVGELTSRADEAPKPFKYEGQPTTYEEYRRRADAGNKPRRYTEVNADTGEATERPERARPAAETRELDRSRATALAKQAKEAHTAGEHEKALGLVEQARELDPERGERWDQIRDLIEAKRPKAEAASETPEPSALPREVMTADGRSVLIRDEDGDQIHIYDPTTLRQETLPRDQILIGGPTRDNPATVSLDTGPASAREAQQTVALYRFEDVRDGSAADETLGAELGDDRATLTVHNVPQAVAVLDAAIDVIQGNLNDRNVPGDERARMRTELTATRRLRAKIVALIVPREGAQSAPTEGEDRGPSGTARPEALSETPAGDVRGDRGPDDVLPGTEQRRPAGDRAGGGRADRGDRPEPARRRADRAAPDGADERRGRGVARDDSDRPGDRTGTGGDGRQAERGDGGVSGSEEPAQPEADPRLVDAVPDTGAAFHPDGIDDLAPAGERAKLDANLAALRTLRALQQEQRPATPEEQAVLARWAGWGGLPDVFEDIDPKKAGRYASERAELQTLLSPAEYREASRNTLNAHYTDARAVQAMWQAVQDLGFDGGRVLEPGSGSGNFIGFAPDNARMVGVELDSTTAAISKALYPDAEIRNESFAETRLPDGIFDMTIGNVPFGRFAITDKRHNRDGESIHNHFILKSLALTKPGGLVTVLSSRFTLDSETNDARRKMAEMADLVGAVRLPTGSHQRASGTNVIEDILIFRRREPGAEPRGDRSWINATVRDMDGWELSVNDYWDAHPDHVLGEMSGVKGQFGGDIKVTGDKDMADLPGVLDSIVAAARAEGLTATPRDPDAVDVEFSAPAAMHEGGIVAGPDGFTQNVGGIMVPFDVPDSQREELRSLLGLRDAFVDLLNAEAATERDTPEIGELRATLNDLYDAHVARFKPINFYELTVAGARKPRPQGGFRKDPSSAIVRALENYNPDDGTATKADVFTKRSVAPRALLTSAETPADALALCIDMVGRIDLPTIARLLNTDEADAREQLGDLVFEQPPLSDTEVNAAFQADAILMAGELAGMDTSAALERDLSNIGDSVRQEGGLVTAAEYLSGNVRRKLAAAKAAAEHDPRFKVNADALAEVVPRDLTPQEIEGRLGASWITAGDVKDFVDDLLEIKGQYRTGYGSGYGRIEPSVSVSTSGGGLWNVEGPKHTNLAREQWGTDDRSAIDLIQSMLEQRPIKITRSIDLGGGEKKSIPDLEATLAAQAKAEAIAERFSEWLWEDPARSRKLQARYNSQFNAIRLRSYDGDVRTLPGLAQSFTPWPHQHAAVSRVVNEPAALLAHVVGSGKTAEMAMGAMELKRLGMVKKPCIVVPNHMKEQFQQEFLQLYPQAKILAAGTEDLAGPKRREFAARAASGDWDCVILTQEGFKAIPMSAEQQRAYIDREMADMRRQLEAAKANAQPGDKANADTVKRMERAILAAEEAMKKKLESGLKDSGGVTWEQTGIDYLFVDEAHQYSNLRTLSNIPGAGATGSAQATDLHMKIEYLRETNASDRVVTFATGTPIRNTVTQAYVMQRYLRPDLLKQAGINSFDQWAATFGKIVEEMELKPEGTGFRQTSRFAKFQNVPELLQMFHVFTDVKTAQDLNLPTPALRGGKAQNVVIPRTPQLAEFIKDLGRRADLIRSGNPEMRIGANGELVEDNMLLVSMDGRKAALNMRLVGGEPEAGKIDTAADEIFARWNATKSKRYPIDPKQPELGDSEELGALQIAFLDMGTPKDTKRNREEKDAAGWDAYNALKRELIARGMAPESIRFMHEAKNDREKAELFAAARSGRIAVLVGSTEKMGVGTNIQRRAIALHHLDAPWRPSDVEQRDGRIMRQGNLNEEVEILRYVTEGSFDAYMWQTLERKSKFINQILRGRLDVREIEDIGDNSLSYAEVKALATGNPDLMDKAKVDTLVGKLTRLQRTHDRTQSNLRFDAQRFAVQVAEAEAEAGELAEAVKRRVDTSGDAFAAGIGRERHAKRAEANTALNEALHEVLDGWSRDPIKVGTLSGFDLMARRHRFESGIPNVILSLDGVPGEVVTYGPRDLREGSPSTVQRIENTLRDFEARRGQRINRAEYLRGEIEHMQARTGLAFERAAELEAAQRKSARLQAKMLLDARRALLPPGDDSLPFDPTIDSARFDSPLVGGGTAADGRPDPDGTIEREEWEAAQRLRREQAQREAAEPAPNGVETALAKARAAVETVPGAYKRNLQNMLDAPRDAVHASPDGRVIAVYDGQSKRWIAVDAGTGLAVSPTLYGSDKEFHGDIDAALAELAELNIPWGDHQLTLAKINAKSRNSNWRWKIEREAREIWERHAAGVAEEKSLGSDIITELELLQAQQAMLDMRGFA